MPPDIVNTYFKMHYPAGLKHDDFEPDWAGNAVWSRYRHGIRQTIFPKMVMADGFEMSVQGHFGAYSYPRDDFAEAYSQVEVGYPTAREELLMPYIDGGESADPLKSVYGYVPVAVVEAVIIKHGGLVETPDA